MPEHSNMISSAKFFTVVIFSRLNKGVFPADYAKISYSSSNDCAMFFSFIFPEIKCP